MTTNPDARPEPIAIDTFEGEKVRFHRGKLPAITLEMAEGYPRGTHLFFQVEARVGPVKYDEITAKRDERVGELIREHTLYIEEVGLLSAQTSEQADPGIGGSAGATVFERDDFEDGPDDCYFDNEELELVHRGACGRCRRRSPFVQPGAEPGAEPGVTDEEFLEAYGLTPATPSATPRHDPGF